MNGHVLMLIGFLILNAAGSLKGIETSWNIIFHSTDRLQTNSGTTIYFMLSGTQNILPMKESDEIISNENNRLTFDAGSLDIEEDKFGEVNLLIVGRVISFKKKQQKDWYVTKVELVSSDSEEQRIKYTFDCNCIFKADTPDHHIFLTKKEFITPLPQVRKFPFRDEGKIQVIDNDKPTQPEKANSTSDKKTNKNIIWLVLVGALISAGVLLPAAVGFFMYKFKHKIFKPKTSNPTVTVAHQARSGPRYTAVQPSAPTLQEIEPDVASLDQEQDAPPNYADVVAGSIV